MSLPKQTLAALQSAGAAIFQADLELKSAVQTFGDQVKAAMTSNPFETRNDGLFEEWKTVARLSQAVAQIEAEFKKIYEVASGLTVNATLPLPKMPTLAAPLSVGTEGLELVKDIQATDAVIKKPRLAKVKPSTKGAASKPLTGNTAKLYVHLLDILSPNDFVKINRSTIAIEVGIPKGSIGASIAKLLETGHLVANASGAYKLSAPMSPGK
jgi:hypothetical protein